MKRVSDIAKIKTLLSEIGTTCYLCGVSNLHYRFAVPENVDPIYPDRVVILCKDCSARRRKRPVHAYVSQRFSEVAAEYSRLAVLLGKLPTQFGGVRETPKAPVEDLGSLVDNWGSDDVPVDVSSLHHADPRLDMDHAEFDEDLYNQWITT